MSEWSDCSNKMSGSQVEATISLAPIWITPSVSNSRHFDRLGSENGYVAEHRTHPLVTP